MRIYDYESNMHLRFYETTETNNCLSTDVRRHIWVGWSYAHRKPIFTVRNIPLLLWQPLPDIKNCSINSSDVSISITYLDYHLVFWYCGRNTAMRYASPTANITQGLRIIQDSIIRISWNLKPLNRLIGNWVLNQCFVVPARQQTQLDIGTSLFPLSGFQRGRKTYVLVLVVHQTGIKYFPFLNANYKISIYYILETEKERGWGLWISWRERERDRRIPMLINFMYNIMCSCVNRPKCLKIIIKALL